MAIGSDGSAMGMRFRMEITQEQTDIESDDWFWRVELMDTETRLKSAFNSELFSGYLNGRAQLTKTMIEGMETLDQHLKDFHRAG